MRFPLAKNQPYKIGYRHGQMSFHGIHNGIDLIVPTGTDWHACLTGKVVGIYNWINAGKSVDIANDLFLSRVCHSDKFLVFMGQKINEGDVIVKTGNTGLLTTASHAHWMMQDRRNGKWFSPLDLTYTEEERPLYTRINEAFRFMFGRNPNKKESDYYLKRCGQKPPIGWITYEDMVNTMNFYHGQGKTIGK